jgi:hypothetical protein
LNQTTETLFIQVINTEGGATVLRHPLEIYRANPYSSVVLLACDVVSKIQTNAWALGGTILA